MTIEGRIVAAHLRRARLGKAVPLKLPVSSDRTPADAIAKSAAIALSCMGMGLARWNPME